MAILNTLLEVIIEAVSVSVLLILSGVITGIIIYLYENRHNVTCNTYWTSSRGHSKSVKNTLKLKS